MTDTQILTIAMTLVIPLSLLIWPRNASPRKAIPGGQLYTSEVCHPNSVFAIAVELKIRASRLLEVQEILKALGQRIRELRMKQGYCQEGFAVIAECIGPLWEPSRGANPVEGSHELTLRCLTEFGSRDFNFTCTAPAPWLRQPAK